VGTAVTDTAQVVGYGTMELQLRSKTTTQPRSRHLVGLLIMALWVELVVMAMWGATTITKVVLVVVGVPHHTQVGVGVGTREVIRASGTSVQAPEEVHPMSVLTPTTRLAIDLMVERILRRLVRW